MNFEETAVQSEIRDLTRKFATQEIAPIIEGDEKEERFRPELIQKLGEIGLTGVAIPEDYDGAGLGSAELAIVVEEIARVSAGYAISVSVTGLPQSILRTFGNEEQKKQFIPPLARGECIGAFSLSEASSGSDAGSLRTQAKRVGKDYVLSGTKLWASQSDSAETIIVFARTGEPGPKGISAFIVEKSMKGLSFGKREKKMGMGISHTMEIVLDQVKVPESHLIGKEGQGFQIAMNALDSGRINIGACSVGLGSAALDVAVSYSKEREQFGKPLAAFQGISFMLANMAVERDAARLMVQRAAWLKDQNKEFSQEAAMAKLFASNMAMKVTTDSVQVLGGAGYTQDFPVERWMREAKVMQIVEGANQIQQLVIGRHLTGITAK